MPSQFADGPKLFWRIKKSGDYGGLILGGRRVCVDGRTEGWTEGGESKGGGRCSATLLSVRKIKGRGAGPAKSNGRKSDKQIVSSCAQNNNMFGSVLGVVKLLCENKRGTKRAGNYACFDTPHPPPSQSRPSVLGDSCRCSG